MSVGSFSPRSRSRLRMPAFGRRKRTVSRARLTPWRAASQSAASSSGVHAVFIALQRADRIGCSGGQWTGQCPGQGHPTPPIRPWPSFVEADLPLKAKSALQLSNALRSELKAAKLELANWSEAKRTIFCKGIIEQLREAWDQGIADFVFPVLGRFDNAIKGASLFKLAVLTDEDVKTVTAARGRLSEELHFTAETLNPESVSREELVDEAGKLEGWLSDINQRQKDARRPA